MFSNRNMWSDNTLPTLWFSEGLRWTPGFRASARPGALFKWSWWKGHSQNMVIVGGHPEGLGFRELTWISLKIDGFKINISEKKEKGPFSRGYVGFRGWVFFLPSREPTYPTISQLGKRKFIHSRIPWQVIYVLDLPQTRDSSQHQDDITFFWWRESQPKHEFATATGWGV